MGKMDKTGIKRRKIWKVLVKNPKQIEEKAQVNKCTGSNNHTGCFEKQTLPIYKNSSILSLMDHQVSESLFPVITCYHYTEVYYSSPLRGFKFVFHFGNF